MSHAADAVAQAHWLHEPRDLVVVLAGVTGEHPVRVDGDRVADRFQHRQIGVRVAVGVGLGEVDALPLGQGLHLGQFGHATMYA